MNIKEQIRVVKLVSRRPYEKNRFFKRFLCAYHWSLKKAEIGEEKWENFRKEYIEMTPKKQRSNRRRKKKILKNNLKNRYVLAFYKSCVSRFDSILLNDNKNMTKEDYDKIISLDNMPANYMKVGRRMHLTNSFMKRIRRGKTLVSRAAIIMGIGLGVNYVIPDEVKESALDFFKKAKRELIDCPNYDNLPRIMEEIKEAEKTKVSMQEYDLNIKVKRQNKSLMEMYKGIN
ncbi:MAG: hypothetical protein N4A43_04885 [Alphaproteobacteria bacterium]|jgi:hypothetical protein|nr:hypothetical protein [Alphaproteobacteria bacterium]